MGQFSGSLRVCLEFPPLAHSLTNCPGLIEYALGIFKTSYESWTDAWVVLRLCATGVFGTKSACSYTVITKLKKKL